jgi:hypothetical protein
MLLSLLLSGPSVRPGLEAVWPTAVLAVPMLLNTPNCPLSTVANGLLLAGGDQGLARLRQAKLLDAHDVQGEWPSIWRTSPRLYSQRVPHLSVHRTIGWRAGRP